MNPEATGNVAGFAHRSRAFDIPTENLDDIPIESSRISARAAVPVDLHRPPERLTAGP